MEKQKHYTLEYLTTYQREMSQNHKDKFNKVFNKLFSLFPVSKEKFSTITDPWAFKCVCGKYTVQSYSPVALGRNISCGCHKGVKGKYESFLRAYTRSLNTDYVILKEGSHIKTRDWKLSCKKCLVTTDNGSAHDHLYGGKKFCKCSSCYKYNYQEIKEECYTFLQGTNWGILNFPNKFTSKRDLRVNVKCNICSYTVYMRYTNLRKKRGCAACANKRTVERLSKNTVWFVERASHIHNHKYDYSKVIYNRAKEHVEIICNQHEKPFHFFQSPDNHINKGKGCPECKRMRLRYVAFRFSLVDKKKDFYNTLPSGLYVVRLFDNVYKIGISCLPEKRFKVIKNDSGFDLEPIVYKPMNMYDALMFENSLHKLFEECNFQFDKCWAGHSECFTLTQQQLDELLSKINDFEGWNS